jgi:uncharacterized protein (TIGR02147 family)
MSGGVFEFSSYKAYLAQALDTSGEKRGARSRLARALGCGSAFVSQVLQGDAHFSAEHAILINEFLEHDETESHFFMLLLQKDRAGSKRLEGYFEKQLEEIRQRRQNISERVGQSDRLSEAEQVTYYSHWYFAAIHVLTSIPTLVSKADYARALGLSVATVSSVLDFLVSAGLVLFDNGRWRISSKRIHLEKNSPMIARHHANWRWQALHSLEEPHTADLHFSGVWTLGKDDVQKIREILLGAIERTEPVLRAAPEEVGYGIAIDFFRVTKGD